MRQAMRQAMRWATSFHSDFDFLLSLSLLGEKNLPGDISRIIEEAGLWRSLRLVCREGARLRFAPFLCRSG